MKKYIKMNSKKIDFFFLIAKKTNCKGDRIPLRTLKRLCAEFGCMSKPTLTFKFLKSHIKWVEVRHQSVRCVQGYTLTLEGLRLHNYLEEFDKKSYSAQLNEVYFNLNGRVWSNKRIMLFHFQASFLDTKNRSDFITWETAIMIYDHYGIPASLIKKFLTELLNLSNNPEGKGFKGYVLSSSGHYNFWRRSRLPEAFSQETLALYSDAKETDK